MTRALALLAALAIASTGARAGDPPQLKAIEARYDLAKLDQNEKQREKYIMELSTLRWSLARHNQTGWEAVDAEVARHPLPANADSSALTKRRAGKWLSPRHDYLFTSNGTWIMDPGEDVADGTSGAWSIHGNQYSETLAADPGKSTTWTIILLNADTFIYTAPGSPEVFYEQRAGRGKLPLRRDD